MLAWVRTLLENWVARAFFALLVVVFVFWGISNVVTLAGTKTIVAHVGDASIDVAQVQAGYQAALDAARAKGGQPDETARRQLAQDALADVIRQTILRNEEKRLGVSVPDDAVRQAIAAIPAFQTNGTFDSAKFNDVLSQNHMAPSRFVAQVKGNVGARQLLPAVLGGVAAPAPLVAQIFDFVAEQRTAEMVTVKFASQPAPQPPADAVLLRYWRNHSPDFTAPEYRTIKLVVLSPEMLATHEIVPQASIDAAFARAVATQPLVDLRSVQVIMAPDLAASSRLQAAWKGGASWASMTAMAKGFGANALELNDTQKAGIPAATLADAVFSAPVGVVNGPIAGANGMFLFRVTKARSGAANEAVLRGQITQQLQLQRAQADVAKDVDKLQDALAGQTPLDQLPGDLGLAAVQGTLDANGNTPAGTPAPLPGSDALKSAIVKAAFAAHPHDPAQLINGPAGSYFALSVDTVVPPAIEPYDQARAKVLAAWQQAEISREAEVRAAALLAAVKGGQTLDAAASAAGLAVSMSAPLTRNTPPDGVPGELVTTMFNLKLGDVTMQQTPDGFVVAVLAKIVQPEISQDPNDAARLSDSLAQALQNDVGESFLAALEVRDKVTIDQTLLAQIYQ